MYNEENITNHMVTYSILIADQIANVSRYSNDLKNQIDQYKKNVSLVDPYEAKHWTDKIENMEIEFLKLKLYSSYKSYEELRGATIQDFFEDIFDE